MGKSEFTKNVITLVSGTTFAQIIPFVIAPVLSRIYTPQDFGLLAIYMAIVQTLVTVSTARYEMAIMLPDKDKEIVYTTLLSMIISVIFSTMVLICVIFFSESIATLLGDEKIRFWLFLVPLSVLLISIYNCLNYYSLKKKEFKTVAISKIYKSTGEVTLQTGLSVLKNFNGGLILGYIISHIAGNVRMLRLFFKEKHCIKEFKYADFMFFLKRFKIFPKHSLPSILFNTVSLQIPVLFISKNFSVVETGFYSFSYKYITAPMNLIGTAVGQVFFQQLAEKKDNFKEAEKTFIKTLIKLFIVGLIVFVPMFFFIVPLFKFFFGENWTIAGKYGKIILPLIFTRFVVSPLTLSNVVYEKEKVTLVNNSILFGLTVLSILVTVFLNLKIEQFLHITTYLLIFGYIFFLRSLWDVLKREGKGSG
ncbi:lipopolysaccharide biosynthesis protein [Sinomicrobium sp. M5D2P9]